MNILHSSLVHIFHVVLLFFFLTRCSSKHLRYWERERHGRTMQSESEITECDSWIAADMKSRAEKETRQRDNRVRRDSTEREARMRAFEWKAKRATGKSQRESGRRKGWEKTDISFTAVELFKKREGEKDPSACSQRAWGGGVDRTAQKREVLKVKARKLPCMRAHGEAFQAAMRSRWVRRRDILVAFVSLKVTDLSSMLHTLRTDTWHV